MIILMVNEDCVSGGRGNFILQLFLVLEHQQPGLLVHEQQMFVLVFELHGVTKTHSRASRWSDQDRRLVKVGTAGARNGGILEQPKRNADIWNLPVPTSGSKWDPAGASVCWFFESGACEDYRIPEGARVRDFFFFGRKRSVKF
jgi:hypothetical protein